MAGAAIETLSEHACFGGVQGFYRHQADSIGLPMKFGVYLPPQAAQGPVPVLVFLAGLACTEETFAIKAGAQQHAARHGLMLVTPDTSPRDTGIPGATAMWDFGEGAGFYLDATAAPWDRHWQMDRWITEELPQVLARHFPCRAGHTGIFGHSMGGHGALTLALRHPGLYRSVSAIAPIAAPMQAPWGQKAFLAYLGPDRNAWAAHDATELVTWGGTLPPVLLDQGLADKFLVDQLHLDRFEAACRKTGQALAVRRHPTSDHGYYFIQTVVGDHVAHHAATLCG